MKIILGLVLVVVAFAAGAWLGPRWLRTAPEAESSAAPGRAGTLWTCGMHPQVLQNEPGACPICGMQLTPTRGEATPVAPQGERRILYWWDPMMNPPYVSDQPGRSPMGMDLVPRYADEVSAGSEVTIDPVMVQNMGVRLATVEAGSLETTVRAVGFLKEAQPNIHDITLKFGGYVDALFADTEGVQLHQGTPLFTLYSPELLVAQEELIAARRMLARLPDSAAEELRSQARGLADSARHKLRLWDLSDDQIEAVEALERADGRVTVHSPADGILVQKDVVLGAAVAPGARLLRIVDYSLLWLDAQVYEYQIPLLGPGQRGVARVLAFPGQEWDGAIVFASPSLDPATRTATVRMALRNEDLRLRPGMYARVEFAVRLAEQALLVPREAVLDTGTRQVVFVARGGGKFEPRHVRMGAGGAEGAVQILDGLARGESVVVSGQFLIDTESRMREAIRKLLEVEQAPAPHAHPSVAAPAVEPLAVAPEITARVDALLPPYLELSAALAADGFDAAAAARLQEAAAALAQAPMSEAADAGRALEQAAAALRDAPATERRRRFGALSETLVQLAGRVPPSPAAAGELHVFYCPMFPGHWVQSGADVRNPFYGSEMLRCGDLVRPLRPR